MVVSFQASVIRRMEMEEKEFLGEGERAQGVNQTPRGLNLRLVDNEGNEGVEEEKDGDSGVFQAVHV